MQPATDQTLDSYERRYSHTGTAGDLAVLVTGMWTQSPRPQDPGSRGRATATGRRRSERRCPVKKRNRGTTLLELGICRWGRWQPRRRGRAAWTLRFDGVDKMAQSAAGHSPSLPRASLVPL
jgi:hypothetical protein